jgi:predicted component of type VI protein secretion system
MCLLFLFTEIAKKYPPSLRLIVTESCVDKIQQGELFVVTYKGGSLGREGEHHHVLLTAENVSKDHLKFSYNRKREVYQLSDSSRNGTWLNGKQISLLNKSESEPQDLHHGDVLEIANVKLLAHIHEGLLTCDQCEPFNYTRKPQDIPAKHTESPMPSLSHKEQLKMLQKRYGLQAEKYQESQAGTSNKNYEDRASQRRQKVGSSHDKEKTIQASVDQSIPSENKGFKLLSKMGWSTGESLGKNDSGIKEPVQMKAQQGTSGLGHEDNTQIFAGTSGNDKKKKEIWSKTQERYNKLKEND